MESTYSGFLWRRLLLATTLVTLASQIQQCHGQQAYLNNKQFDCTVNHSNTLGFLCNSKSPSCTAYLTFQSAPSSYTTPPAIAYLTPPHRQSLGSTTSPMLSPSPSAASSLSPSVAPARPLPTTTTACIYYQHNATYALKITGEEYYSVANVTYRGLTTCQAMIAQNHYSINHLQIGDELLVPLFCACPTASQTAKYGACCLLSYIADWHDDVSTISAMFGVDEQSILDANELSYHSTIFPFTPILVPLKSEPTKINFPISEPPLSSPPPLITPTTVNGGRGGSPKKWVYIVIGVGSGVLLVGLSFLAWYLLQWYKKPVFKVSKANGSRNIQDVGLEEYAALPGSKSNGTTSTENYSATSRFSSSYRVKSSIGSLTVYKYEELQRATGDFTDANKIKGSVFKGTFNGDDAAIKILRGNIDNKEINILNRINHSSIIRLSGFCKHEGNTYLVYEYAEKGSLRDWLDGPKKGQPGPDLVLGWKQRVQIACDVADALRYLHSYISPPYIHKNLNSSVVLLDTNFKAKITNFGLARTTSNDGVHLTENVVGTYGYLAPEYVENGMVTTKMDVFALGVLLLELLSGKPAVMHETVLLSQVIDEVLAGEDVREKLKGFMDAELGNDYPLDLAYSTAQLAKNCVAKNMNVRPSLPDVSMTLSKIHSSSLDWDSTDELGNYYSFSRSSLF